MQSFQYGLPSIHGRLSNSCCFIQLSFSQPPSAFLIRCFKPSHPLLKVAWCRFKTICYGFSLHNAETTFGISMQQADVHFTLYQELIWRPEVTWEKPCCTWPAGGDTWTFSSTFSRREPRQFLRLSSLTQCKDDPQLI
jgi:hypothetical protein